MSELCHTPGSGLRHTISFKPLTNPMRRNEHYRHLLMREVEGREELSLFNEDYSGNGPLTSNSLAACEVNGYHLTLKPCAFHTRQACEASFLRKLPSFCPWSIHPYTSSHSLPHRSFTREILHLSTYKSFLTSINTLLSSSYNHCLWHHGKILLVNSDI